MPKCPFSNFHTLPIISKVSLVELVEKKKFFSLLRIVNEYFGKIKNLRTTDIPNDNFINGKLDKEQNNKM